MKAREIMTPSRSIKKLNFSKHTHTLTASQHVSKPLRKSLISRARVQPLLSYQRDKSDRESFSYAAYFYQARIVSDKGIIASKSFPREVRRKNKNRSRQSSRDQLQALCSPFASRNWLQILYSGVSGWGE